MGDTLEAIQAEQAAFDQALPQMLEEHPGEFVVFRGGEATGYFSSFDDAYSFGLDEYGLEAVFLVSEVRERRPEVTSLSWDLGVMFGEA